MENHGFGERDFIASLNDALGNRNVFKYCYLSLYHWCEIGLSKVRRQLNFVLFYSVFQRRYKT